MAGKVKWKDIEQEVGPYQDRFVLTYLKYEGMATDEKDANGRAVKVTQASFARHMGIVPRTFNGWVQKAACTPVPASQTTDAKHFRTVKTVARRSPSAVVDAIQAAGTHAEDEIFHELKLRRAGFDTSKANKKAANAFAHNAVQPMKRALVSVKSVLMLAALESATEHLQEVIEAGVFTRKLDVQITEALDAFQTVRAEGVFAIS